MRQQQRRPRQFDRRRPSPRPRRRTAASNRSRESGPPTFVQRRPSNTLAGLTTTTPSGSGPAREHERRNNAASHIHVRMRRIKPQSLSSAGNRLERNCVYTAAFTQDRRTGKQFVFF